MFEEFTGKVLSGLKYYPTQSDPSLYFYVNPTTAVMAIMGIFVDNMIVASLDPFEYQRIMKATSHIWVTTVKTEIKNSRLKMIL